MAPPCKLFRSRFSHRIMTSPSKLNEFNHAEDPARQLLEQLGWTYAPAEALASKARMHRRGWPPRHPGPPHRSWERTT